MDILKPKKILSLDFGSRNIKIALLEKKGEDTWLTNYSIISLPEKFEYGGMVSFQLEDEIISQLIGWGLREAEINEKNVIITLPFSSSFFKIFQIPPIDPKELKKAINFEIRKYLPGKIEEFVYQWEIFKFHNDPKEVWSVCLFGFPQNFLEKYQKIIQSQKLKLKGVYFENMCLPKIFDTSEWIALIDFGHLNSIITFASNGQIKFAKTLNLNGQKFTSLYSNILSLDFLRAENFKESFGIKLGPEYQDLTRGLFSFLNSFLIEIEREISDFENSYRVSIDRIYFYGGNINIKGVLEYFVNFFKDRKVFIFNPFFKIKYKKELEPIIIQRGLILAPAISAAWCYLNS